MLSRHLATLLGLAAWVSCVPADSDADVTTATAAPPGAENVTPDHPAPGITSINGVAIPERATPAVFEQVTFDEPGVYGSVQSRIGMEELLGDVPENVFLSIELGDLREAWTAPALLEAAAAGQLELELPLARHLPALARPSTSAITPRMILEHSTHLGGSPEDWDRRRRTLEPLALQTYLANLGPSDTPGERPSWHAANIDLQVWLSAELGLDIPSTGTIVDLAEAAHHWAVGRGPDAPRPLGLRRLASGTTAQVSTQAFEGPTFLVLPKAEGGIEVLTLHGTEETLAARRAALLAPRTD